MVESNTTQDTEMLPAVDEDEDGPFLDWDLGIHDDHWALGVPKPSALDFIAAKHGVDASTAETLFLDVFCQKFQDFLDECLADVVSSPIDLSGFFPRVKLPFSDRLAQSLQTQIDSDPA